MRVLILAVLATLALAAPAAAAPQWLQPVDIAGPSEQNMLADVSVAANGTTLVVFTEFVNGFERVRARVRPPGGGFGPVMELSPADKHGSAPSAAVDGQGNFTVAFTVDDPTAQVRAARLPAGAGAFEGAETVSTGANALEPEVAVGGNGTAVIVYLQGGIVRGAIRNGASGEFNDATMLSDSGVGVEEYFVAVGDGGRPGAGRPHARALDAPGRRRGARGAVQRAPAERWLDGHAGARVEAIRVRALARRRDRGGRVGRRLVDRLRRRGRLHPGGRARAGRRVHRP